MNDVFVSGYGVVCPAGWGVPAFRENLARGEAAPLKEIERPGWTRPLRVCPVPPPASRPSFLTHPRLRRTSSVTQYAAAAGLEALGEDAVVVRQGSFRLGLVVCVMGGCVGYSRRFFKEVLENPATASPLVFPETVFNAPASHVAALLGSPAINYTLVGDPGMFLQGLALGAEWIVAGRVEGCLVIGTEELDWLSTDAFLRFKRTARMSEGAGAIYLKAQPAGQTALRIEAVTDAHTFSPSLPRAEAVRRMRAQLGPGAADELLFDSTDGCSRGDRDETAAWRDWRGRRTAIKSTLGEGLAAASAWQCVAGLDALRREECSSATISVAGINQQAIGARFGRAIRA